MAKLARGKKHIHGHTQAETKTATTTATHITFKSRRTLHNTLGQDLDIFLSFVYISFATRFMREVILRNGRYDDRL